MTFCEFWNSDQRPVASLAVYRIDFHGAEFSKHQYDLDILVTEEKALQDSKQANKGQWWGKVSSKLSESNNHGRG